MYGTQSEIQKSIITAQKKKCSIQKIQKKRVNPA